MIKLEDLKLGDKVYGVCQDGLGLYSESVVNHELLLLDRIPKEIEAVICSGGLEAVTRSYEPFLFKTKEEAKEKLDEMQLIMATNLLNSEDFVDKLFECATTSKRLNKYGETPIFKIAVNLYKEKLQKCTGVREFYGFG